MIRLKKTYTKAELEHPTEKMWKQCTHLSMMIARFPNSKTTHFN